MVLVKRRRRREREREAKALMMVMVVMTMQQAHLALEDVERVLEVEDGRAHVGSDERAAALLELRLLDQPGQTHHRLIYSKAKQRGGGGELRMNE
jgi:hypothetical protein